MRRKERRRSDPPGSLRRNDEAMRRDRPSEPRSLVRGSGSGFTHPDRVEALVRDSADPDMARTNLTRWQEAAGTLPDDLEAAVTLFASSRSMAEAVIRDPPLLTGVLADRRLPDPGELRARAVAGVMTSDDPRAPLRLFVRTETLRLLLDDLLGKATVAETATHLSRIADAAVDAALASALARLEARHGAPRHADGSKATLTVLGMGKLGGTELNYSSDIDLIFLYSGDGKTDSDDPGSVLSNEAFFSRAVARIRALLADATTDGHCYRVDLRLRPDGSMGKIARTVSGALAYYDRSGRTWERQAFIKARPIAGDLALGEERFLEPLASFVYGTALSIEEIRKIKDLKLEIERRGGDERQVKAGRGGIRDVEFTVQFLQLLSGREYVEVRVAGTLPALDRLTEAGILTAEERDVLRDAYLFLRLAEHRIQTLFEIRTHTLPAHEDDLRRLAVRMGLRRDGEDPLETFRRLHARHTGAARGMLERLFHNLFLERSEKLARLSDFILDPEPHREAVREWLTRRGFADADGALRLLTSMAAEQGPRARSFFASICPGLALRVLETPDPDRCLINLDRMVRALGGGAILYQLFAESADVLAVFADISGWSQHLSDLLVRDPAMLDALVDSLVVGGGEIPIDDLPLDQIEDVADPRRLLTDFRDIHLVRIGVRDIQRKANTENTSRELTSLAERILALAIARGRADLEKRFGPPAEGGRARFAVLGLGRLGAGEMSYASDLDLIFVMDAAGRTTSGEECAVVLSRLAQGVVRLLSESGPHGRLYEVDSRVRPHGRSGPLVTPLAQIVPYYRDRAAVAELQMLSKARVVAGDDDLGREVEEAVAEVLYDAPPREGIAREVLSMRGRLQERSRGRDVKRGFGGIVDIEFLTECLKLVHGRAKPSIRRTGTLASLAAMYREGLLNAREHEGLLTALQFLRSVESRIRIVWDMGGNRIPEKAEERNRLAKRLGYVETDAFPAGDALLEEYEYYTRATREVFETVLGRQGV